MGLRRKTTWRIEFKNAFYAFAVVFVAGTYPFISNAAPSLLISQYPLQLSTPTHPKVLLSIGNSQSMDGILSGAIMTGSGILSSGLTSLQNSSSPLNYTVPAGFTPPLQAANSSGLAPYTVSLSGTLYDNSASRLNVAKGGVTAILNAYMQNTDFALETYNTSSVNRYTTWVYYMSVQGGPFTFTNTQTTGKRYVINPCFGYTTSSSTIASNCASIAAVSALYGSSALANNQYMQIGSSSDDPTINDILYAGSPPGVFVTYSGPSPATPYPPNFSLSNYNNGNIFLSYSRSSPNIGGFGTGPTNAGFVPFSPQVMYAQRGFGFYGNQSATSGKIIVPMTTAGTTPTTSSITTAINTFLPYLKPETNSTSSTEIKSSAVQSPMAGLLTTAKNYLTSLGTSGASCTPQLYVVLISDGLPTEDLAGKLWPPLGSAAAAGYGVTATFNTDGSLKTTNAQALTDTITILGSLKTAGIKTFVIGLGAGVDPTVNSQAAASLTAMSIAGGTINYYPASSPAALVNGLNNILISVQSGSNSTTAAAVNSSNLQAGSMEYQASFIASDTTYQDWTGNLVEIALDPTTGSPTGSPIWSAQTALDTRTSPSRIIATWNPALNSGAGGGAEFQWANISAAQQTLLQPSDTLGANRLLYLRGDTSLEKRNGGTFRNRTHLLGDIVDSRPMYVGIPSAPHVISSTSYLSFALSNMTRQPMLYVGANDGMLHAINATTGVELFAFVPNGIFNNLLNLTDPLYNQSHLFFVDGSPQSADVQFADGSWHTLLVGGENGGGSSIYALNVTNPTSLTTEANLASAVLWEFTDTDMGLSYSEPKTAQISTSSTSSLKFAVFFGNGYNSPNNKDILYAVDPQTGQTLGKIDLCAAVSGACDASLPNGLSTVAFGQSDGLQTSPITRVYAGDLQGNMWSVDVSNTNPASWTARLLMQARDSSGNPQPITTPPVVTLNPNYPRSPGLFVMFGTGSLLTQSDLASTKTQSIYSVWDNPASTTVITRSSLQQQVLTLVAAATSGLPQDILTVTNHTINWVTNSGWYTDLPIAGQRVITNSNLVNGSFIATLNTPPTTACGQATSMLLTLSYKTGGDGGGSPQLDINADNIINSSDTYNGGNAVGIGLKPGYASAPVTVGPNANNYITQLITLSSGQQISVINPNNSSRQTGWWQLQ